MAESTKMNTQKSVSERSRSRRAACVMVALLVYLGLAGMAWPQAVTSTSADRVSVTASNEKLGELLRELQTLFDFEKLIIDPTVEQNTVTIELENEPVDEAIMEILEEAKVSGVVWGGNGKPYRVFAGSGGSAKIPEPTPPQAAEQDQQQPSRRRNRRGQPPRATYDASLATQPTPLRIAGVGMILGLGLLVGRVLVFRNDGGALSARGNERL